MTTNKTTKQKAPLEKDLNKQIISWLDILPSVIYFERMNSGKIQTAWGSWVKLCRKGTPDFIALVHGGEVAHILFIEAKRKGEKQRPEQKWFQEKVAGVANVHYVLVYDILTLVSKINEISSFS